MIQIRQAKTSVEKLGNKMRRFEQTSSNNEIPLGVNGKWLHGLNEEEQKKVEEYFGHKFNDPESFNFWSNYSFTLNHYIDPLESLDNPEDLLKVRVLQRNGTLAKSYGDANNPNSDHDFVIYDENEEVKTSASLYKRRDKAIAELIKLSKTEKYCIAVAKFLLPRTVQINDVDKAYLKLREFVDGKILDRKNEAIDLFNRAIEMDKAELYVTVDFNDAIIKNVIRKNDRNYYYNPMTGVELGKTEAEAIAFLLNPKNAEEIGLGTKVDKSYSIRYQLNNL